MAKAMIVFEDVNPDTNEGKPVIVRWESDRTSDCQDEPTIAEGAASAFFAVMMQMLDDVADEAAE